MIFSLSRARVSGGMFDRSRGFNSLNSFPLRRDQFGNADQIVGDQIENEVGGDAAYAPMFCLAHRTVLLAPTEDAFDHRAARLRHAIAFVPRAAFAMQEH